MSDVLLYNTLDDGEIGVIEGTITTTDGTDSAVYLSLFGGNVDGSAWWGDSFETVPERQSLSNTQAVLQGLPLIPANLLRIQDAVKKDLSWMTPEPEVIVAMPALNRVQITVNDLIYTLGK